MPEKSFRNRRKSPDRDSAASAAIHGYVRLPDASIFYQVWGNGPPLVLLHGNGESTQVFEPLVPALCADHQVTALDTRGHGRSERGTKPLNFDTFARDLKGTLNQLEMESATLVGYSDGGNTALHFALAFPERVRGLVLLGANLHPQGVLTRFQLPILFGYGICSALSRFSRKARENREQLELMVHHPNLTPVELRGIQAPTLVVAGEKDIIKRSHTEEMAKAIPGARLAILPGETHFSLLASGGFQSVLADFLQQFCL